ncbi:MAG: DNA polymerase III subunit gamma/tau [Clostridia bacterium]
MKFYGQVSALYQALYRKWRPQTFDEVIGQQHITETLKNQVRTGRLSHAYLFIGTRGTGKTTCARILARAVNCEHPVDGNPCGVCPACRGILEGSVMDVVELDAASNNGVDNVRALREEAIYSPASVKKRVYIIDEVHMLSAAAFNALLKILEEPPAHLMFILATTELNKVPATILSRCQRHSFKRIDVPEIAEYLEYIASKENIALSHEAAELIARLAEGGVRDALSLLDQCSSRETIDVEAVYAAMGLAGKRRLAELLDLIIRHETAASLQLFSELWMDGKDPGTLLAELAQLLRDVLMLHVAPKGSRNLLSSGLDLETLRSFAARMTREELLCALEKLQSTQGAMRTVNNPRMNAELCLVSLCDNSLGDSTAELRARLSRLEEQLRGGLPAAAPLKEAEPQPAAPRPEPKEEEPQPAAPRPEPKEEEPQPAPPVPEEAPTPRQEAAEEPADLWKAIQKRLAPRLTMELRTILNNPDMILGAMKGELLQIEAAPGYAYMRFNRPELLQAFAETATAIRGRETRVQLADRKPRQQAGRSLDELRGFQEVHFIE